MWGGAVYKSSLSNLMAVDLRGPFSLLGSRDGGPVLAVISGVIPFLHSPCKATKCPRCEEVKMRSTQ